MTGPTTTAVPPGTVIVLDRHARVLDGGAVLLGGAPPRMLRLAPAARALLVGGRFTVAGRTSATLARTLLDAGIAHPGPGAQGPPPGDVTVVIPVKDRLYGLTRLLAALTATGLQEAAPGASATATGLHEAAPGASTTATGLHEAGIAVIVVDDGSSDAAGVAVVARSVGARLLRHDRAQGPAAARNAGLAAATTPLVAFLDSDVVPGPGWLAPLLAAFADPAVGLVAPRIVALPPVEGRLGTYEAVRSSLDLGPDPALVVPRSRVAYVPSAAMLVRRDAAGAGFDEAMHVAEDVDLVLRLHAAGWRLRYEPASRVAHDHRTTPRAWLTRKAFYGTGAAPLALRHPGAVPPMVLSPWGATVGALLLLARPWSVPVAVAVSAVAAERLARRLGQARRPRRTAARLIALGSVGAVAQTADAVVRHYWPVTIVVALASRRFRRTAAAIALTEGVLDWARHRRRDRRARPGLLPYLVAHRLDDLAYGAGLWWGAWTYRTTAPLRPAGPGRPTGLVRKDESPPRLRN